MSIKLILILFCIGLLIITPVFSKEVTAVVDDKGLIWVNGEGLVGTLHTDYGTIIVTDDDYNKIMVNDTIKYNTDKNTFWRTYWEVEVI